MALAGPGHSRTTPHRARHGVGRSSAAVTARLHPQAAPRLGAFLGQPGSCGTNILDGQQMCLSHCFRHGLQQDVASLLWMPSRHASSATRAHQEDLFVRVLYADRSGVSPDSWNPDRRNSCVRSAQSGLAHRQAHHSRGGRSTLISEPNCSEEELLRRQLAKVQEASSVRRVAGVHRSPLHIWCGTSTR